MARGESQGLQVAVILLTMCVVGLGVSTWVFYQSSDTNFKQKETADAAAQKASADLKREAWKVKVYRTIVGSENLSEEQINLLKTSSGGGDPDTEAEWAKYKELAAGYDKAFTAESRGLKLLPTYLTGATAQRNQQLSESLTRETALKVDNKAIEDREAGRAKTAEEGRAKAEADLAEERTKFGEELTKVKGDLASLEAAKKAVEAKLVELENKAKEDVQQQIAANDELRDAYEKLLAVNDDLKKDGPAMGESPDGEITWVNQRQRLAWINLGSGDNLARQMTFSVYGHDENGVSFSSKPKAKIEVIRINEVHMAECRILEDSVKSPILPGDKIFTPAWTPGQVLHIALAGEFDLNDDQESDNAEMREIIQLNKAVVDAEILDDGTVKGSVTARTRYLVRGDTPTGTEAGDRSLASQTTLIQQAKDKGVQIIDGPSFLAMMGWKSKQSTTKFGNKRTVRRSDVKGSAAGSKTKPAEKTKVEDAPADEPATETPAATEDINPFE